MVRVAVVGGSYLLRQGIARVLGTLPDIALVATCETAAELARAVEPTAVDVVVTEIRGDRDGADAGIALVETVREARPGVGVVILGQVIDAAAAVRLFHSGSAGRAYVLRGSIARAGELERLILTVAGGGSQTDSAVVDALVAEYARGRGGDLHRLTSRELGVLALVADGVSNAGIARRLVLTKRAVEQHVGTIYTKLELPDESIVSRRVQAAVLYAAENPRARLRTG